MATNITYGGYSLQTTNIITGEISHDNQPAKKNLLYTLARADGARRTGSQLGAKTIRTKGVVAGTGLADLESRIDALKAALNLADQNLDVDFNGTTRRYVATTGAVTITRNKGVSSAGFTIDFDVPAGFGVSTSNTTLITSTVTTSSQTFTPTVPGTAAKQWPVFTLTVTSFTGTSINWLKVYNTVTGQGITVTRSFTAGDVVVIDTGLMVVTVNGVAADYSGAFPYFAPGSASVGYQDNFSARSVSLSGVTNPKWL